VDQAFLGSGASQGVASEAEPSPALQFNETCAQKSTRTFANAMNI
jgi:hypothetical protein